MFEQKDSKDISEWQKRFCWLNPSEISIKGDELHWGKISQTDAIKSFETLKKMKPYLENKNLFSRIERQNLKDNLQLLTDNNGTKLFDEQEIRFYELYFGDSHILVDHSENGFGITNGRHRLWLAKQHGIKELPVWVNEKTSATTKLGENNSMELVEVQNEAEENKEQAEQIENEVENHKQRVDELDKNLQEFRTSMKELSSDQMRSAEASLEKAKKETDEKLEELKKDKEKLLEKNKEYLVKITDVVERRKKAIKKMDNFNQMFEGASSDFIRNIKQSKESLEVELIALEGLNNDLLDCQQKLESIDV